jgi:Hemerythrin HHE cation binding domain
MEAKDTTIRKTPCSSPLPELEVPMINTMVPCLGVEHRKLNDLSMQLAYGATTFASDSGATEANSEVLRVWDEIRQDLWSHLQIESGLVSWGEAHHAISGPLLDMLERERHEMRKLIAALHALSPDGDRGAQTAADPGTFAQTLLALAQTLDSHVERYDGQVLPSILRALFPK